MILEISVLIREVYVINKGDLVLDNTFGSGSFLVGAILESRNVCGIELNKSSSFKKKEECKDYLKIAYERIYSLNKEIKINRNFKDF